MNELTVRALKKIIRETGARPSRGAARELARSLQDIAWEIAERSQVLAEHAGRRIVKDKDIRLAVKDWKGNYS